MACHGEAVGGRCSGAGAEGSANVLSLRGARPVRLLGESRNVNERVLSEVPEEVRSGYYPGYEPGLIDLAEFLRIFQRRAGLLLGTICILMVVATLAVHQLSPRYTASTKVLIDPKKPQVVDIESVVSSLTYDNQTVESEIAVIQSRTLIGEVIDELGLYRHPEFNPALRAQMAEEKEPLIDWNKVVPRAWVERIFPKKEQAPPDPEKQARHERTRVINAVAAAISVKPVGRSRVVDIAFSSGDPELAADVVNALARLYIVEQLKTKFEGTRQASEWLNDRLGDLRRQVKESEIVVENFRARSGLIEGRDTSIVAQQITELNTQLVRARSEYEGAKAQLAKIEELFEESGFGSILDLLGSDTINRFRIKETELKRREAELLSEYGPKHPIIVNLRQEMELLNTRISSEAKRVIEEMRSEVAVSLQRVLSYERSLEGLKGEAAALNSNEVALRQLEREAAANRAVFETFLNRFKETEQIGFEQPDARIVSEADIPTDPSFPNKRLLLAVAFVGALGIGLGLVYVAEILETGFLSTDQIERELQIAGLGLVPRIKGARPVPQDHVIKKPLSAFAESMRSLFTAILLQRANSSKGITIMFTSAVPSEGKTSIVSSLARVIARSGRRVIVLDCDLRRPRIHKAYGAKRGLGLTDFITGTATMETLIQEDSQSDAHFISAGHPTEDPQELLRAERMRYLIDRMRDRYDVVLLDAPPVLPVSDAKVLCAWADICAIVVKWRATRRAAARTAVHQMVAAKANIAGVVLSQVNVRRHAKYGYGDSGYYYGDYKKYYRE